MLTGAEFDALVRDIVANGLLEPITLHTDGSILDGRNRYRACIEARVEPAFVTWDGPPNPVAFVISKNLARRHLTTKQRAALAAEMATMKVGNVRAQRNSAAPNGATVAAKNIATSGKRSNNRVRVMMFAISTVPVLPGVSPLPACRH